MALVPCYECGAQISTSAASCPHCGAPAKRGEPTSSDAARAVSEPRERDLLNEGDVLVTTRRFVVDETTYAIRGVTSVASARERIPGTVDGSGKIIGGAVMLFIGVIGLGAALADSDKPGQSTFGTVTAIGAALFWWGQSQWRRAKRAIHFVIRFRSASGDQQVYASTDAEHVARIVGALTEAIGA